MNLFLMWLTMLEPVVCKAIAIIPHLKEIVNIAFKPHNGIDVLEESDHKNLRNRINFIDRKLVYIGKQDRGVLVLDELHRRMIIQEYNEAISTIEVKLVQDFIVPTIEELLNKKQNMEGMLRNKYVEFFSEEKNHSQRLYEQTFFVNPIKQSLLRDLDAGLDHLIHLNPRRLENIISVPKHPGNDLFGRIQSSRSRGERDCIRLLSFTNYLMNEMGVRRDGFLNQFYYYDIINIYSILVRVYHRRDGFEEMEKLRAMFDRLTIQCTIILRLLKNTSCMDIVFQEYFFPTLPLNEERKRLCELEKDFTSGFAYALPGF